MGYMQGDLNQSIGKKTAIGKNYQQLTSQSQFYTLLSCAKSRDKIFLLNFEPDEIKVNGSALEEMSQMRNESLFSWKHPNGISIYLFNTRPWNGCLELFTNSKIYPTHSSLFCFTETNIYGIPAKYIDKILEEWKNIHKNTQNGLALCYNIEVFPIVLEIEKEKFLLVIV